MKKVIIRGKKYTINHQEEVDMVGDLDEEKGVVFIDKEVSRKYWEGIAIHEVVERKWVRAGHTYVYSHEKAQEAELTHYRKKYGKKEAEKLFWDEEEEAIRIAQKRKPKRKRKKKITILPIKRKKKTIIYEGTKYKIDNNHIIHHAIVDIDENKKTLYVDKDVPKKYLLGLALWQIEERKGLRKGLSYEESDALALQEELEFFKKTHGKKDGKKMANDLDKIHKEHFANEEKELKEGMPIINKKIVLE